MCVCVVGVFFETWVAGIPQAGGAASCWPVLPYSCSDVHEASAAQLIFMGSQRPKTTMPLLILRVCCSTNGFPFNYLNDHAHTMNQTPPMWTSGPVIELLFSRVPH